MFTSNTYNPDSQPLGHYRGYPVYLTTVLVGLHILSMLLGVFSPAALAEGMMFAPGWVGSWVQVWRWVTYAFVHQPDVWFVINMFFLYRYGMEIEKIFGRTTLIKLYGGLLLLAPAIVTVLFVLAGSGSPGYPLAGTSILHFSLFLGMCLMYPGGLFFCSLPWLTLKIAGPILLGIYVLSDLASRQWTHLLVLLASVYLTYFILRRAGLSPRFEAIKDALRDALPARRPAAAAPRLPGQPVSRRRGDAPAAPSRYYEPKIKPKPDLAPERKAVEEIDGILDKIAKSGMDSLTAAEKTALQNASSRLKDTDY
ncbi:MAG: glpG [Verrucomicrobiales bacterium]|nr:glpG [Verrucomicrobiales bacterium]